MFVIDRVSKPLNKWTLDEEKNPYITETAGFVPLEVKLKQFEASGYRAQLYASEFTSSDLREIYLNPNFEISPDDDLEDIHSKLLNQKIFAEQLAQSKLSTLPDGKVGSPSLTPEPSSNNVDPNKVNPTRVDNSDVPVIE